MPNSIQNDVYSKALGRNTSLTDKFFTGDETTDFGLDGSSQTIADTSNGIHATDYLGNSENTSSFTDMFDGVSLSGAASAIKGVAAIYDSYNKKQYQDKIFGMEEARVNREVAKQKKAQEGLEAAWS